MHRKALIADSKYKTPLISVLNLIYAQYLQSLEGRNPHSAGLTGSRVDPSQSYTKISSVMPMIFMRKKQNQEAPLL